MESNTLKMTALALLLIVSGFALYIYRPTQSRLTRITVIGDAQTKVAPDTAQITFSVVTQNGLALNAQQENARKSEAVKQAVEASAANAKPEVKTSDYNLAPQQDYSRDVPKISGYEVKNTVTVSISDLAQVGAVIDAATKAGANSVEGIQFVLRENSPAQGDALALATQQAKTKAEAIAQSLGGKIVRVVESIEGGAPIVPDRSNFASMANAMMDKRDLAKPSYNTPVQAGSLNVRSQVVLVVEVEISR